MIDSNLIPRRYVPGRGAIPARLMFVGEAPGFQENRVGLPFVGPAGWELDRYASWAGIDLSSAYITNLYKFWPFQDFRGKQLPPSPDQIAEGAPELATEIALVRPDVIVAIGAHAARHFLGPQFKSMRRDWGVPRSMLRWTCGHVTFGNINHTGHVCNGESQEASVVTVIALTHPAAGLHSDREQVNIQEGFLRLGRMIRGQISRQPPINHFPNPRYERLTDTDVPYLRDVLAGKTAISIDTEGSIAHPWCLTFTVVPGEAFLIRATEVECLAALDQWINAPGANCTVLMHYAAHDIPVLAAMGVRAASKHNALNPNGRLTLRCTMSEAFLGGTEPKGLKDLSWRLSGGEMRSYEELVGPTETCVTRDYVTLIAETFRCGTCGGEGKGAKWKSIDTGCVTCHGSGRMAGKRAGTTKTCDCVKTHDRCRECVDGLQVPLPEREFVFEPKRAEFRWKQPQSIGKWVKRRMGNGNTDNSDLQTEMGGEDGTSGVDSPDGGDDAEPAAAHFKLRKDWRDLAGRSDVQYVEAIIGPMPRTTLTEVEAQEGEEAVTSYACADSDFTFRNAPVLEERLAHLGLLEVREQDAAFVPMLSRMEQVGMRIDRAHFLRLDAHLDSELDRIRESLANLIGRPANPNSPVMVDVLFRELSLPIIKFTKSGARESIDDDVLGALRAQLKKRLTLNPDDGMARLSLGVCDHITDYREIRKLKDYTRPILQYADRNDRIHTTLSYTTAATGRLTSSEPINLQTLPNPDNYPTDTPEERNYGVQIRKGFVAKPGYRLAEIDFSQIEMVVGAHLTQDAGMLDVFRRGLDLHYYAASLMFDLPYDQIPKATRTQVKPLNFGAFYGLSAMGLQAQFASFPGGAIEKSEAECQELIDRYYRAFPGVMAWKERLWQDAERDGYVRDLFGRIRWVPGLRSRIRKVRGAAEREAANMPVQSSANGIIRIASRRIWERDLPEIWRLGVDAEVIMQTHDANTVEAPAEHIGWVSDVLAATMRNAVTLSVPIRASVKIGDNLAEAH